MTVLFRLIHHTAQHTMSLRPGAGTSAHHASNLSILLRGSAGCGSGATCTLGTCAAVTHAAPSRQHRISNGYRLSMSPVKPNSSIFSARFSRALRMAPFRDKYIYVGRAHFMAPSLMRRSQSSHGVADAPCSALCKIRASRHGKDFSFPAAPNL